MRSTAPALMLMGECVSVLDHLDFRAHVREMLGELVSPGSALP